MSGIAPIIEASLGYQYIGYTLSIAYYGITVTQTYLYYRGYSRDTRNLKSFVFILFLLDTLCAAFVAHALYVMLVVNWGDIAALQFYPWTFAAENGLTVLIAFLVQCFFAVKVWEVSGRSYVPSALITISAMGAFGAGLALTSKLFVAHYRVTALQTHFFTVVCSLDQGFASLCDIAITASLCYYLKSWRSGAMNSTVAVVDQLFAYAIGRGMLTATIQILALITFTAVKQNESWMLAHLVFSKVYINTMLAILNGRSILRNKLDQTVEISGIHFGSRPEEIEFGASNESSIGTGMKGLGAAGKGAT